MKTLRCYWFFFFFFLFCVQGETESGWQPIMRPTFLWPAPRMTWRIGWRLFEGSYGHRLVEVSVKNITVSVFFYQLPKKDHWPRMLDVKCIRNTAFVAVFLQPFCGNFKNPWSYDVIIELVCIIYLFIFYFLIFLASTCGSPGIHCSAVVLFVVSDCTGWHCESGVKVQHL